MSKREGVLTVTALAAKCIAAGRFMVDGPRPAEHGRRGQGYASLLLQYGVTLDSVRKSLK